MKYYGISEHEEVCANCRHFYQHYGKSVYAYSVSFAAINAGHCVYPRTKNRYPYDTCKYFEKGAVM